MFGWLCITVISFAFLHWGRHLIQREKPKSPPEGDTASDGPTDEFSPLNTQTLSESEKGDRESFIRYCILLACLAFICAQMNGVVPNIQSYSALPYSQVILIFLVLDILLDAKVNLFSPFSANLSPRLSPWKPCSGSGMLHSTLGRAPFCLHSHSPHPHSFINLWVYRSLSSSKSNPIINRLFLGRISLCSSFNLCCSSSRIS